MEFSVNKFEILEELDDFLGNLNHPNESRNGTFRKSTTTGQVQSGVVSNP